MKINKKNIVITVLVIAIIFLGVVVIKQQKKTESFREPLKETLSDYLKETKEVETSDVFKKGFMEGCVDEATGQEAYCECAYEGMLDKIGKEGIVKMGLDFYSDKELSDETLDVFVDVGLECLSEYK